VVKNSRKSAAILANLFFDNPTSKFKLIGITGTNGKTTTANLIYQILIKLGYKVGIIGTFGYTINNENFSSKRTTPDIIDLNKIFQKMEDTDFVVMEVSSHAIALQRVFSLSFDAGIFTNLTQDHLDFHKNLKEYAQTKFKLFDYVNRNNGISIVNTDDKFGKDFFEKINGKKFNYSKNISDYQILNIEAKIDENKFTLKNKNRQINFQTNLIGNFNIYNLVATISVLDQLLSDISLQKLANLTNTLSIISGRLEKINNDKNIGIFIDYAHTPDALKNVLSTLFKLTKKRIITVFGAGGERDKTKRPAMLKAALKYSDFTILTNDNPRYEKSEEIINDLLNGAKKSSNIWIMRDRKIAIESAIKLAQSGDIVLIAGKGHETYQAIKGKKIDFNDKKQAINALSKTDNLKNLAISFDPLILEYILDISLKTKQFEIITEISTDSRNIKENSLFIALKGDNFDGHDYVNEVLKKNCWAIVNTDFPTQNNRLIKVQNTLEAYGKLANHYRKLFGAIPIGITGTYGKTTVKEYLGNILEENAPVLKTYANENNLIGLPKTIFKLQPFHKFGIFELGSNQFGEIAKLTKILEPEIGIITAVGPSHLEFLENENGVYEEKSALLRSSLKRRYYPGKDEKFLEFEGKTFGYKKNYNFSISAVSQIEEKTNFKLNNENFSIPTPFSEYALNAGIAISVCQELGFANEVIQKGLNKTLEISARMEIVNSNQRILLIDCYNANPDSMKAAITFWKNYHPEKPHIALLGDMLELGELTEFYHKKIWHQLKDMNYNMLISVGKLAKLFGAEHHFEDVNALLKSDILKNLAENSVILLKASHGIELEKIIKKL